MRSITHGYYWRLWNLRQRVAIDNCHQVGVALGLVELSNAKKIANC